MSHFHVNEHRIFKINAFIPSITSMTKSKTEANAIRACDVINARFAKNRTKTEENGKIGNGFLYFWYE